MKAVLVVYCLIELVGITICLQLGFKLDSEWMQWKNEHLREYESDTHELERYVIWKSNKAYVDVHNELKDEFGYFLALNQFGDLVSKE